MASSRNDAPAARPPRVAQAAMLQPPLSVQASAAPIRVTSQQPMVCQPTEQQWPWQQHAHMQRLQQQHPQVQQQAATAMQQAAQDRGLLDTLPTLAAAGLQVSPPRQPGSNALPQQPMQQPSAMAMLWQAPVGAQQLLVDTGGITPATPASSQRPPWGSASTSQAGGHSCEQPPTMMHEEQWRPTQPGHRALPPRRPGSR